MDTSRECRFVLGVLGAVSAQRGVLWWASTHRHHHQHCDTHEDLHSPETKGYVYAHVGWLLDRPSFHMRPDKLTASEGSMELYALEACFWTIPIVFSELILDRLLHWSPTACKTALSLSFHSEWCINSLCHCPLLGRPLSAATIQSTAHRSCSDGGTGRTEKGLGADNGTSTSTATGDRCVGKDVWWVGVLNGGEGFHGCHHANPGCACHGQVHLYDIDLTYYVICALERLGLVWNVQHPGRLDTRGEVPSGSRDYALVLE
jgi:stearoyl-CoA desaturase (Delta-9 desaturase)